MEKGKKKNRGRRREEERKYKAKKEVRAESKEGGILKNRSGEILVKMVVWDRKNGTGDLGEFFQKGWEVLIFGRRKRETERRREERRKEYLAQEEEMVREEENTDFGRTRNF